MIHCSEGHITLFHFSQKWCWKDLTPGCLVGIVWKLLEMLLHVKWLQIFMNTSGIHGINQRNRLHLMNLELFIWRDAVLAKRSWISSCVFRPKTIFILRFSWKKNWVHLDFISNYLQLVYVKVCGKFTVSKFLPGTLASSSCSQWFYLSFTKHSPRDLAFV